MEKVQVKPKLFQRFDEAFCRQVVAEVEAGCRQRQIAQHYGLTPGRVNQWMKRFGSQHYAQAKPRVVSELAKRQAVRAVLEERSSRQEVALKLGLRHPDTVQKWIRRYESEVASQAELDDNRRMDQPPRNILPTDEPLTQLRHELAKAHWQLRALETLIETAQTELGVDIRKKSGRSGAPPKQSKS